MASVTFGSVWPTYCMTYGTSSPTASSNEMNVRRSEWGVSPSGSRPSPAAWRRSLARRTAPANPRLRTLLGLCLQPVAVANTRSSAPASERHAASSRVSKGRTAARGSRARSRLCDSGPLGDVTGDREQHALDHGGRGEHGGNDADVGDGGNDGRHEEKNDKAAIPRVMRGDGVACDAGR